MVKYYIVSMQEGVFAFLVYNSSNYDKNRTVKVTLL